MGGLAMMAEVPQLAIAMCEHGCVESMIYIMSNTDSDELHMRAAVCLRAMCSVDKDATKLLDTDIDDAIDDVKEEDDNEAKKKEEAMNNTTKKTKGDPTLALRVLAGYEHTAHYDGMNDIAKNELIDHVNENEKWLQDVQDTINKSKEELEESRETLFMEQNSQDDEEVELNIGSGSVEIEVLEEEDDEGKGMDSKVKDEEDDKAKEKEKSLKPLQEKKALRIERLEKKIVELEKTLTGSLAEIQEAKDGTKNAKKMLLEWNPEVWKGGIAVLNAFTKIPQIGEMTKAQVTETLKLLSDRL
jgi:hypothetical protein